MGKTPLPVQGPGFHPWSGSWLQHAATEEPRASARMEGSECGNEDPEEQKKKFPFKIMRKLTIRISFSITEANCCGRIAPIARGASFATVAFPDVSILLGAGGAFPGDARGNKKIQKKGNVYVLGETRGKIKWIFFKISYVTKLV